MPRSTAILVPPPTPGLELFRWLHRDRLEICAPLTLSLNRQQRQGHWRAGHRHAKEVARWCDQLVNLALGYSGAPRPWATQASLRAIRCSLGPRTLDADALTPGLKPAIDACVRAGLLPDDDQAHLLVPIHVEDRRRGHWAGRPGPATWLIWERVS